ncbi:MAG: cytochrome-c peroxidase, partial [Sphingobacterium sp.]
LLFIGIIIVSFTSVNSTATTQAKTSSREKKIQREICNQILSFQNYVKDTLFYEVSRDRTNVEKVRRAFLKSRLLFKKFEWATAYFTADLNNRLNGPPIQEIENADLLDPSLARGIDPMGLQVIEEYIFPEIDTLNKDQLTKEVDHLITNTAYLVSYFSDHQFADWRILDAAKLEVFRIISLGITGFDNALSLHSMQESSTSLVSLRDVLRSYTNKNASLLQDLDHAIIYLDESPNFDSFDRAVFITRYANPISTGIAQLELDLPGRKIRYNRMLRQEVKTMFDSDAFNGDAFSPGPEFHLTEAKVELGKKLFYDGQLSGNGVRSCASCHNPNLAFSDGLAKQTDIHDSTKLIARNTPTLLNAALQSNYFYDMRALTI